MRVIFHPEARAEFIHDIRYYAKQRHGLGVRFRNVVEEIIQHLGFVLNVAGDFVVKQVLSPLALLLKPVGEISDTKSKSSRLVRIWPN